MSTTRRCCSTRQAEAAAHERFDQIKDYYESRRSVYARDPAHCNYKPLPPEELYLDARRIRAGAGQDGDRAVHAIRRAGGGGQDRGLRRRSGAQFLARAQ